jgi:hypothetical protein
VLKGVLQCSGMTHIGIMNPENAREYDYDYDYDHEYDASASMVRIKKTRALPPQARGGGKLKRPASSGRAVSSE